MTFVMALVFLIAFAIVFSTALLISFGLLTSYDGYEAVVAGVATMVGAGLMLALVEVFRFLG